MKKQGEYPDDIPIISHRCLERAHENSKMAVLTHNGNPPKLVEGSPNPLSENIFYIGIHVYRIISRITIYKQYLIIVYVCILIILSHGFQFHVGDFGDLLHRSSLLTIRAVLCPKVVETAEVWCTSPPCYW